MLGDSFTTPLSSDLFGATVFFGLCLVSLTGVSGTVAVVFDAVAAAALAASLLAVVVLETVSDVCQGQSMLIKTSYLKINTNSVL